jgi:hypothetical protein
MKSNPNINCTFICSGYTVELCSSCTDIYKDSSLLECMIYFLDYPDICSSKFLRNICSCAPVDRSYIPKNLDFLKTAVKNPKLDIQFDGTHHQRQ